MRRSTIAASSAGAGSPGVLLLRKELADRSMRPLGALALGQRSVEIAAGHDAIWVIVRRRGRGGLAMRAAFLPAGYERARVARKAADEALRIEVESPLGTHRLILRTATHGVPLLQVVTVLTPGAPLLLSFIPRDLYPFDEKGDPLGAKGRVEAAQRGMNTAGIYFRLAEPDFGSVLYLQDLTTLNPFFAATKTKPDGAVGGVWPEIGYLVPTPPQRGTPPTEPLPANKATIISDAHLAFYDDTSDDEQEIARRYLALLGAAFHRVSQPPTEYRDWVERAARSLADLAGSPKATIRHYGHVYAHPYTDAEYPDSMVQLSLLATIRDYEVWSKKTTQIGSQLAAGLAKFYDPRLKTLRRYLPNVGKDKDRNAVDSWYLYHPLSQLARLAIDGDKRALRLFRKSIDYGIKAAHHFDYCWPIQYDVRDFRVITAARDDDGRGQTDVGGIYAYVMLQAFDLTNEHRFLDEARRAIDATKGMRFELNYQANLTAWGAAACLRLWRITNEENYLRQSYVFLASFFHNTAMWESEIDHARHYRNFLGVTALHDAPYMALYECFDSFAAFERYLKDSGPDVDPAVRLLLSEYCRYALDRAWFYYPDALPPEVLSDTQRETNGHIDRALSFPVEDLYVDGQLAGQVGQEIYGAGAAFVFASRTFHKVSNASFSIFCDHFLMTSERIGERAITAQLAGGNGREARFVLLRDGRKKLPDATLTADGVTVGIHRRHSDRIEYRIPADARLALIW